MICDGCGLEVPQPFTLSERLRLEGPDAPQVEALCLFCVLDCEPA